MDRPSQVFAEDVIPPFPLIRDKDSAGSADQSDGKLILIQILESEKGIQLRAAQFQLGDQMNDADFFFHREFNRAAVCMAA